MQPARQAIRCAQTTMVEVPLIGLARYLNRRVQESRYFVWTCIANEAHLCWRFFLKSRYLSPECMPMAFREFLHVVIEGSGKAKQGMHGRRFRNIDPERLPRKPAGR